MKIKNIIHLLTVKEAYLCQHQFQKDKKTIVFQEMMHIAPKEIYAEINHDILEFLKKRGSRIYLEGIKGNEAEIQEFCTVLFRQVGFTLNTSKPASLLKVYEFLGNVLNWSTQNKDNYLKGVNPKKIVRADITAKELIINFEKLPKAKKEVILDDKKIVDLQETAKKILSLKISQWLLKQILKNNLTQKPDFSKKLVHLMHAILNKRNECLLNYLNNAKENYIFVTYGALHLNEIKETLIKEGYSHTILKKFIVT